MQLPKSFTLKKRISVAMLTPVLTILLLTMQTQAPGQDFFADPVPDHFELGIIPVPAGNFVLPTLADIDGDDDLDLFVLTTTVVPDPCFDFVTLNYYENIETNEGPVFQSPIANPFGIPTGLTGLTFVDIDDDNDLDLFSFDWCLSEIIFIENTGLENAPNFGAGGMSTNPFGINPAGIVSANLSFGDMDNDGDYDIFINGRTLGHVIYQENTGTSTSPQFGTREEDPFGLQIPYTPDGPIWAACVDWNCDGNLDILNTLWTVNTGVQEVYYYENITESPDTSVFGSGVLTNGSFLPYTFGDLDKDGDSDFLYLENYYQNIAQDPGCVTPTRVQQVVAREGVRLYPNPASNFIYLEMDEQVSPEKVIITVYDVPGRVVINSEIWAVDQVNNKRIDIADLQAGLYWVKITSGEDVFTMKFVKTAD